MNIENWILFFTISLLASLSPGPSIVAVLKESASRGLKHTMPLIVGVLAGLLFLAILAGFGLGVVLEKSPIVFTVLRYVGGTYLLYLGVQAFFFASETIEGEEAPPSKGSLFFRGLGITLANPKALVFFSALFIPFIDQSRSFMFQFSVLVITMMGCSLAALLFYGLIGEKGNGLVRKYAKAFNRLTGSAFMGFSVLVFARS